MSRKELFEKIESYATELLSKGAVCDLCYHNIEHTRRVVRNVEVIGAHEGVSDEEMFILKATAWFHDLGYVNVYDGHEDESKVIATAFLKKEGVENVLVEAILNGIDSTRMPQKPKNRLERMIVDADLFDLGTDAYFELSKKLFNEWGECGKPGEEIRMWQLSLEFLKGHMYYTSYGIDILKPKKKRNIKMLEIRLKNGSF